MRTSWAILKMMTPTKLRARIRCLCERSARNRRGRNVAADPYQTLDAGVPRRLALSDLS